MQHNEFIVFLTFKNPRYNIMLFMPTDKTDTHHLARNLNGKSLRLLRKQLQPTWVRATIPSFMLHGFVTLTSFLQRVSRYIILNIIMPFLMSNINNILSINIKNL